MEYLDILDLNGNATGNQKLRKEVHRDGDYHRSVHVWVINPKKELLVQKRSPQKDSHPYMWDISVAGHILSGGNSLETAIKEVKEELGIVLDKKYFNMLFTLQNNSIPHDGFINNEFQDIYLVNIDLDMAQIKLQKDEVSEIKFINFQNLEKIINSHNEIFVRHDEEYKKLFKYLKNAQ